MSRTVFAVFLQPDDAERAIGALEDHGFSRDRISVATMEQSAEEAQREEAQEPLRPEDEFMEVQVEDPSTPSDMNAVTDARLGGFASDDSVIENEGKYGLTTTTPADAARGAAEGGVIGLGLGVLAGAAALLVPGVGPVLAAGPLWVALGGVLGTTAAGAVAGGVTGYLVDQGVAPATAESYASAIGAGSVVVTVHAEDRTANEAAAILGKYGGTSVAAH